MTRPELSAEDILAVLNRHQVDYVVIGAFAAIAQGAPLETTHDVDVTPHRETQNLRRLSAALTELDARIRVDDLDEGLVFEHDSASLSGMAMLNLTCAAGDFDIVFAPAGAPAGYEDLVEDSVVLGSATSRWPRPASRMCSTRRRRSDARKTSALPSCCGIGRRRRGSGGTGGISADKPGHDRVSFRVLPVSSEALAHLQQRSDLHLCSRTALGGGGIRTRVLRSRSRPSPSAAGIRLSGAALLPAAVPPRNQRCCPQASVGVRC